MARLAQKGKGRKVRFQGGTLFPTVMAVVVGLGIALIVYARQSAPAGATPPTVNDHWHISYGFYTCADAATSRTTADFLPNLTGNIESTPQYQANYIHSHDDGVIHWHAYSGLATGSRAKIGIFLENYGVDVSADGITFQDQNSGNDYLVGETKCTDATGKEVDGVVQVVVWERYDDPDTKTVYFADESLVDEADPNQAYIGNFHDLRIRKDGMAMTIAFVPLGTEVPMPKSASELPALGAVDSGATTTVASATTTTVAGATTSTAG